MIVFFQYGHITLSIVMTAEIILDNGEWEFHSTCLKLDSGKKNCSSFALLQLWTLMVFYSGRVSLLECVFFIYS